MSVTRAVSGVVVVVGCVAVVSASAATPAKKAPRIVAALMRDADRDGRADGVALTYSARIRHARDRDGRYPLVVKGYRIRFVGAASGRTLALALVEKGEPDAAARPAIRYRRTRLQPVTGLDADRGRGAALRAARPHGNQPSPTAAGASRAASAPAAGPPTPLDGDGDGTLDAQDCAPRDAAVHPGAADLPDLGFVDSNCDGIDGTEKDAIFASPPGNDADPGTKAKPKRQIQAAVVAATLASEYVLAAAGSYGRVDAATRVGVYGGYDGANWSRRAAVTRRSPAPPRVSWPPGRPALICST